MSYQRGSVYARCLHILTGLWVSPVPGTWRITLDESEMHLILVELTDLLWAAFVFSEADSC